MKKNDFIENIKKMFSRSDSEKKTDRIHGETAKDKYNNIIDFFKKLCSDIRIYFIIAYDRIWYFFIFLLLTVTLIGLFLLSIGLGYFAALVSDEKVLAEDEIKTNLTEMSESTTVTFG